MEIIKNKNWNYLKEQYDWIQDMETTPQSEIYHAEGNVEIHTKMVLKELVQLPEYLNLEKLEQEILWTAALLHDVEKRSTTIIEDGKISSPNHAKKGAKTARHILYKEIPTPFHIREQIVNLVRFHGLPIWIMEKSNPKKDLYACSLHCNTYLLAILAKADILGRICADQKEMLERIDFFIEFCKEQYCYGNAKQFADNLTQFKYFEKENIDANYSFYNDTICEVIVMSGLPGMGKDKYIKDNLKDIPVISLDEIRRKNKIKPTDSNATGWVVQQAKEQAKQFLRIKQSFVCNATNITMQMRSIIIGLVTEYNASVKLIYIEQPYSVWINQNKNREYMVPNLVLEKLLLKLEVPLKYEATEVEYIV